MTYAQKKHFKVALETKRRELVRDIQAQAAGLSIGEGECELIDRVQKMNQRDDIAIILRRLSQTLSQVDGALRAISEGAYGVCAECGEPIGLRRLESIPWASHCIGCQELAERADDASEAA